HRCSRLLPYTTLFRSVGAIVILPWLQGLIAGAGWRTACIAMAALVLVTLAPLNVLTRRRPEDMGLLPDGDLTSDTTARGARNPSNIVDHAWEIGRAHV